VNGVELDPLNASSDANKPLISKLLAVPEVKARYLGYVKQIAEQWLDWQKLGPVAKQYHDLIAADVKLDTRKLQSTDAFLKGLAEEAPPAGGAGAPAGGPGAGPGAGPGGQAGGPGGGGPGFGGRGGGQISIKQFAEQRRNYLLNHPEVKKAEIPQAKPNEKVAKTVGG
jgi:hypothetical protein